MNISKLAETNKGPATVHLYNNYRNVICIQFRLGNGTVFGGWAVATLVSHAHPMMILDGGLDVQCTNILDVMAAVQSALTAKGLEA